MISPNAFWDSSALIPICFHEATSGQADALFRQWSLVVWWGTAVEIESSFARLRRSNGLNDADWQVALNHLSTLKQSWHEIEPSSKLRDLAGTLMYRFPLAAADSLQLAAALTWCQQRPVGRTFLSGDVRLCDAATLAGFTVIRLGVTTP